MERAQPTVLQRKRQPAGAGGRRRLYDRRGVWTLAQERQRDMVTASRLCTQLAFQHPRIEAGALQRQEESHAGQSPCDLAFLQPLLQRRNQRAGGPLAAASEHCEALGADQCATSILNLLN